MTPHWLRLSPRPCRGHWRAHERFSEGCPPFACSLCFMGAGTEIEPLPEHRPIEQSTVCSPEGWSLSETPCPGGEGAEAQLLSGSRAMCAAIRLYLLHKRALLLSLHRDTVCSLPAKLGARAVRARCTFSQVSLGV